MKSVCSSAYADHNEAWKLLPWYVNSTLKDRDFALVREHVKVCITCRKELEVQRKMAQAIRDADVIPLSPHAGFSHLRRRLDLEGQAPAQRVGRKWSYRPRSRRPHASASFAPVPGRVAIAVSLCASLAIVIALPTAQWPAGKAVKDQPSYRTLSSSADWPASRQGEIYVVFSQAMTHRHIGRLLRSTRTEVIDGPSAVGVYRLRVGADSMPGHDASTVIKQLRRDPGVRLAELAQPIADSGGAGHLP